MKEDAKVILCIDDDPDMLELLTAVLEQEGYRVRTAGSAEEGIRIYKEEKPALILVDLMMEEVDAGTNFVKELRLIGEPPPILMLSSVGDSLALSTDYSELGLAGVLQKPVQPEVLLNTVRSKLGD